MSITQWLEIEEPDVAGPSQACIVSDEHGHAVLYTPLS